MPSIALIREFERIFKLKVDEDHFSNRIDLHKIYVNQALKEVDTKISEIEKLLGKSG